MIFLFDFNRYKEDIKAITSFMTEVPVIQKPVQWFALQNWFLYDRYLRHGKVIVQFRTF